MTIGITNVGNTCCINTCIQCIFHLTHLKKAILETTTFTTAGIGKALHELVTFQDNNKTNDDLIVITPNLFLQLVDSQSNGLFPRGEQHDICELWVWLIDRIHEESAQTFTKLPVQSKNALDQGVQSMLFKYLNGRYSQIRNCVQGSQVALVMCNNCDYRVSNIEPFTVITLNLSLSKNNENLVDILHDYFENDCLDEWKCDKCSSIGGTRKLKFYEAPKTLVLVLKRFQMNHRGDMKKINNHVTIPHTLQFHHSAIISLSRESESIRFKLRSVANHYGSYFGGHYTALCATDAGWKYIDDNDVHDVENIDQYLDKNNSGYMLFYERD